MPMRKTKRILLFTLEVICQWDLLGSIQFKVFKGMAHLTQDMASDDDLGPPE